MSQHCLPFILLVVVLSQIPVPASCQEEQATIIGKWVIAKRDRVTMKVDGNLVQNAEVDFSSMLVVEVDGEWVNSGSGRFIQRIDLVTPEEAIPYFTAILESNPQNTDALQRRSTAYFYSGDTQKQIADMTALIKLRPSAYNYTVRAYARKRNGDYAEAIADYGEAIRLDPRNSHLFMSRATTLDAKGDHVKASPDHNEAIRLAPKSQWPYRNRAAHYELLGEIDKADGDLAKAAELSEAYWKAGIALLRARFYLRHDQNSRAEEAVNDAAEIVRMNPKNDEAMNDLARLRATSPVATFRDAKSALELAKRVCQQSEFNNPSFIETLAAAHAENGDFQQAINIQQQAIRMRAGPAKKRSLERLKLYETQKPLREDKFGDDE